MIWIMAHLYYIDEVDNVVEMDFVDAGESYLTNICAINDDLAITTGNDAEEYLYNFVWTDGT
ncbi:MAG: hypothetical protein ACI9FN_003030 [Saprospiraceae bacterium]|jgi:hypothetical protein